MRMPPPTTPFVAKKSPQPVQPVQPAPIAESTVTASPPGNTSGIVKQRDASTRSRIARQIAADQASASLKATQSQSSGEAGGANVFRNQWPGENDEEYQSKKDNFETVAQKAQEKFEMLTAVLKSNNSKDLDATGKFHQRYLINEMPSDGRVNAPSKGLPSNLNGLGLPSNLRHYDVKAIGAEKAAYTCLVDSAAGKIIAISSYAKDDPEGEVNGVSRLNHSEILWQLFMKDAEENGAELSKLNEIVQASIQGEPTLNMLGMLKGNNGSREKTYTPGSKEFFAVLGTDNCKGTPFLLKDHAQALGHKTIESIAIRGSNYISVKLGPIEPLQNPDTR